MGTVRTYVCYLMERSEKEFQSENRPEKQLFHERKTTLVTKQEKLPGILYDKEKYRKNSIYLSFSDVKFVCFR